MTLISTMTCAKTGTKVEKFLTSKLGGEKPCVRKLITLGENSDSKLKQIGVDRVEIYPHADGSKRILLIDQQGTDIVSGYTDQNIVGQLRKLIKSFDTLKDLGFNVGR